MNFFSVTQPILLIIASISMSVFTVGCSHLVPGPKEPIELRFLPQKGLKTLTTYNSRSVYDFYEKGELVRKRHETIDFDVLTEVLSSDRDSDRIHMRSKTVRKEGVVPLKDLAMPDLDEEIKFIFDSLGNVYHAGDYSDQSIFFVPPFSFPKRAVSIGDSWPMSARWTSFENNLPLQMDIVSILKSIDRCGTESCARIEISGDVSILGVDEAQLRFISDVRGELLFSLNRNIVVWSHVNSEQSLNMIGNQIEAKTCLDSFEESIPPRQLKKLPKCEDFFQAEAEDPKVQSR